MGEIGVWLGYSVAMHPKEQATKRENAEHLRKNIEEIHQVTYRVSL
jgi:hypothetical protein